MLQSWKKLEDHAREIATIIWHKPAVPDRIDGVNFDAVIRLSDEEIVLIEITEECSLEKIRTDVAKILPVKFNLLSKGVLAKSYIVLKDEPTQGMVDIGKSSKVNVLSIKSFANLAFNYATYISLRNVNSFGSAIDPRTGEPDHHEYIPVTYVDDTQRKVLNVQEISERLTKGEDIVLLGDYGTGKSRCVREAFQLLSEKAAGGASIVFAINLREHWGAASAAEIIAGHLQRLGLSGFIDRAMQLLLAGHILLLLDGFDEVGSQTFGSDQSKRVSIRRDALKGIRELVESSKAGVLITGRPHYFNSNKEMLESLGMAKRKQMPLMLKCAEEFSVSEAQSYLMNIGVNTSVPSWLPRKPLMFWILAAIHSSDAQKILSSTSGELDFWGQFLSTVCIREAKIHNSINPESVRLVLTNLARRTRLSDRPLGRLTPKDVNEAYSDATGGSPDESGQLMLSRLCTLGRIEPESPDRQFVDPYIVQLLFAESLADDISNKAEEVLNENWRQPLQEIGVFLLSQWIEKLDLVSNALSILHRQASPANHQVSGELVAGLSVLEGDDLNFHGLQVSNSEIAFLSLGITKMCNIQFKHCIFDKIEFDACLVDEGSFLSIENSIVYMAAGLSSAEKLPSWIVECDIVATESVSNSARIKASNLPPAQKLFLSVIQKIFFQRGGGRKASSLYKGGFGQPYDRKIIDQILAILVNDGYIEKSKDSSGAIYNPKREYTAKMKAIKDQLTLSKDELWLRFQSME
ncbi:hypothetical protein J2Y88_001717 [Pseudomonas chlororaphis]|uniref:NACHT domain-containing protein n=1 Tax=Pseudomonas chlororaphis TaxID=587753 RepID=UPI0020A1F637|nr:NACHT domain-containing protein [Pseudomonas chlororaphis]MCP1479406.1 hypothetical protein [Pseudomonas chlororaphis]MCP1594242.1 hypothetical protein [Pseudomonas chlororaphis]